MIALIEETTEVGTSHLSYGYTLSTAEPATAFFNSGLSHSVQRRPRCKPYS
jgi:hypothetical protein